MRLDPRTAERPDEPGVAPLKGDASAVAAGIRAMADAGADEVILVCDPITVSSVASLGRAIAAVRDGAG